MKAWPVLRRRLQVTDLAPLFEALPQGFQLLVADVGSVGGLHSRWRALGPRLATMNFDPLDERPPNERHRVYPFLLAEGEGEAVLNVTRRRSMSSTLVPDRSFFAPFWCKPEHVEIVEQLTAKTTSLDALVASEGLKPDAIKVDVQGGEGAVLTGASQTLSESVLLAEIECSFAARYEGQRTFGEVAAFMRESGFALLDLRRLKRYRYSNSFGVRDPSLGRGMRAGRLAFCDAIFVLEPERIWQRVDALGPEVGLKAVVLSLVYGKSDLAAATFDRVRAGLEPTTRDAFERFFRSLRCDGGWRHRLHHFVDRWARQV